MKERIEKVLVSEEDIRTRVREMGEQITRDYAGKDLVLVGILKGSVVFMADLMRQIGLPLNIDFISVSNYGSKTSSDGMITLLKDLAMDIRGRDVLIVEDIVDTGSTLYHLQRLLAHRGAASVEIATLLSKPERRKVDVKVRYIGFEVPDEFVVGYGLDFDENDRHWPFVGVLKPEYYQS